MGDPNRFGGGNHFASNLIKILRRGGNEVSLCSWEKPVEGYCHEGFLEAERIYLPSFLIKKFIKSGALWKILIASNSAIKKCVKDFKPDAVINANVEPAAFRNVKMAKRIFYCHFPTEFKAYKQDLLHLIYRIPYWYWHYRELSRLDAIVCNSHYTKQVAYLCWKNYVPKDKFYVIYPAIDITLFEKEVKRDRKICYVGRIAEGKGIEHVLDNFVNIYGKIDAALEIAGGLSDYNRSYYERIRNRISELQREGLPIKLEINVPYSRIIETLLSSRVMVSFNPEEHFGIVPVEAQAAGCVPIVAKGGGQLETVRHRKTGFLVDSPEKIARYIMMLFEDEGLWKKMSQSAKKWALNFSLEKISLEWSAFLHSLAG